MKKKTVSFARNATNLFFHILTRCNLSCRHCYINPEQHGAETLSLPVVEAWLAAFADKGHLSYYTKSDGSLWAMGYNEFGALGDGTLIHRNSPVLIVSSGVTGIGPGMHSGLYITGDTYSLAVSKMGTGTGTVTSSPVGIDCGPKCSEYFSEDLTVTLTATPDTGFIFDGWSGDCTGPDPTCDVTMDQARNVIASFNLVPPNSYALNVSLEGTGDGTVAGNGIDCGSDCVEIYPEGTQVTLVASAQSSSTFVGWGGACTNAAGNCVITMNASKSVTATFNSGTSTYKIFLPLTKR